MPLTRMGYKPASASTKIPKMKPTLHLSEDELPDIKDWKVGQKYELHLDVTMKSHTEGSMLGDAGHSATFQIDDVENDSEEESETEE